MVYFCHVTVITFILFKTIVSIFLTIGGSKLINNYVYTLEMYYKHTSLTKTN